MQNASSPQLLRAVIAAAIGTAIEWYDFFLYGVAAALVFPHLFFPRSDPYTGALLAFSTYFVGFVARPVGAAIFGHYGDRIGRKAALVATLVLMGAATMAVGLVPTYAAIGAWGGVLLTILRVLQGIGVGGEWGGSVLLSLEWSNGKRKGFIASWPQFGVPVGLLLANGALAYFNTLPGFLEWGWRVPFLLSGILIVIGLWIRLGILETPVFSKLLLENKIEAAPVAEVLRLQWREVLLTALIRTGQQTSFYLFTTFVLTYGTTALGMSRGELLNAVMLAAAVSLVAVPFWGHLSDVIGRKRMYLIGAVTLGVFIFGYFAMLDSRVPWLIYLAIALSIGVEDMMYGPQAAFIAESFTPRLRYSGASLGYQLASITAGGPAPLIALALYEHYKSSLAICLYVAAGCAISLVSSLLLRDRSHETVDAEFVGIDGRRLPRAGRYQPRT